MLEKFSGSGLDGRISDELKNFVESHFYCSNGACSQTYPKTA